MTDTIFALASGSQRAGVAVIRVSGPAAAQTFETLTGEKPPAPRMAVLAALKDGATALDRAIALHFKSPASFTGEDVVEYHVHGGRAVIEGVIRALGKIPSCRLAEPGEFTRRAFENGKMDLTEAEAVADLIAAETEAQRMQALNQLEGGLSKLYGGWAETLKKTLAHQEADIEFPDEDMPQGIAASQQPEIKKLKKEIETHLNDGRRGERLRSGVFIAIVGAPNAGKSSLLNALARRDAAIVSDEAGTTRDVIETHLDLGGYPVILADTAGLRGTENKIEAEGVKRAKDAAARADLKLALFDANAAQDAETLKLVDENTIVVFTKKDLCHPEPFLAKDLPSRGEKGDPSQGLRMTASLAVSSLTDAGMDELIKTLTQKVSALFKSTGAPPLTRERHRAALEKTVECLTRCLAAALPELAAEDLRLALRALGSITGRVHVEELLDTIFRDFCIGK